MAIAYVGKAFVLNSTSGVTTAVPMPSATVAGNKLYCLVGSVGATAGSLTAPAGWTPVMELLTGTNLRGSLFSRTAVAGDGSATFTWTFPASGRNFGYSLAYSGVDTAAADLADSVANSAPGAGPWAAPSLSVADGDWLITAGIARENPGTSTGKNWTDSDTSDVERFDNTTDSAPSINISAALFDSNRALTAGASARTLTEATAVLERLQIWSIRVPALVTAPPASGNPWTSMGIPMR